MATEIQIAIDALEEIAQGHLCNGAALPREVSRQIARRALIRIRERWGLRQTEKSTDALAAYTTGNQKP